MTRIGDIVRIMESWAPPSLAETWDHVGLQTGALEDPVESVVIALDITDRTFDIAQSFPSPLIVSHHPLIFSPLDSLAGKNRVPRLIRRAIVNTIGLYAAHTNLDRTHTGVSYALASRLGLTDIVPLKSGGDQLCKFVTFVPPDHTDAVRQAAGDTGAGVIGEYHHCSFTSLGTGTYAPTGSANPYSGTPGLLSRESENRIEMVVSEHHAGAVIEAVRSVHPYEEMAYDLIPLSRQNPASGYGAVGMLPVPLVCDRFIDTVREALDVDTIRVSPGGRETIAKVAVMGGSGSSMVQSAVSVGADAFVTGDIGHHAFLDYGEDIMIIDATHRATELPVLENIRVCINKVFPSLNCTIDRGMAVFLSYH
jgi:dinuclear metal center YbgI/SA1388 family protein